MIDIEAYKPGLNEAIDYFKSEINTLRTGRATPAILDGMNIEVYGSKSPLVQLATISVSDAKTLIVQPWDKNILKDIEKGITISDLNISPVVDGELIRLSLPDLSEENRKNLVKILQHKAENCRVTIRQLREKAKSDITNSEKGGIITEDEKYQALKNLDELIRSSNEKIKTVTESKEKEILTV